MGSATVRLLQLLLGVSELPAGCAGEGVTCLTCPAGDDTEASVGAWTVGCTPSAGTGWTVEDGGATDVAGAVVCVCAGAGAGCV